MYSDTSGVAGLWAIIAVSAILLVGSLGLAFLTLRPHRPRRLIVSWYSLSLANLCLIGVHAAGLATAALMWHRGPGDSPYAFEQYHFGFPERETQDALFWALAVTGGLYSMLIVIACRAAFWEITAHPAFHQHNKARWITLAFDIWLGLAALGTWLASVVSARPCCEGSSQSAADLLIGSVFDEFFGFGFPYIVVLGYISAVVGAFFVRKWARKYSLSVLLAESLFSAMWPVLLVQTVLLIVATAVYFSGGDKDINAFYGLIPWRVQQLVVLGVLALVMRRHSIGRDGAETPTQAPLTSQVA